MSKKIKLGIILEGFIEWGGGIDFIRYILLGLNQSKYEIVFFIPRKNKLKIILKNHLKKFLNLFRLKNFTIENFNSEQEVRWKLNDLIQDNPAFFYKNRLELKKRTIDNKIAILLPCFYSLGNKFPIPWIGYIYDFQHKYLTNLFSNKEIEIRNNQFQNTYKKAIKIIVNAKQVKADIEKFFGKKSNILVLPFTPKFDENLFDKIESRNTITSKYNVLEEYFIISNQFWSHKAHLVAFKAFKLLIDEFPLLKINLVCTGKVEDNRNMDYIKSLQHFIIDNKLETRIILTGFISKIDQLSLLRYATAVIQPTTFEGGPGGGIVYDALGLGVKCLVSDIEVNKEIIDDNVVFFEVNNPIDLKMKMLNQIKSTYKLVNKDELKINFLNSKLLLENSLDRLISDVQ